MISRKIAEQTLAEALRTGGDFAELFVQDKKSTSMSLLDGRIDSAVTGRAHGAGIRIYKGLNSIYVHTNDTSLSGLIAAARKAADAVGGGNEKVDIHLTGSVLANIHAYKQLPMDVSGARKAQLLKMASAAARGIPCVWWDNHGFVGNGELFGIMDRAKAQWAHPEIVDALLTYDKWDKMPAKK